MIEAGRSSRRNLLKAALGVCAATVVPVAARANLRPDRGVVDQIERAFGDRASARVIGAKYLARWPEEEDLDLLVSKVLAPSSARDAETCSAGERDEDVWRTITRNRVSDFENGRIAAIDGWQLSRTEARLCAIVTLL